MRSSSSSFDFRIFGIDHLTGHPQIFRQDLITLFKLLIKIVSVLKATLLADLIDRKIAELDQMIGNVELVLQLDLRERLSQSLFDEIAQIIVIITEFL